MSDTSPPRNDAPPQRLVGFRTNAEWHDLVAQTAALIDALDDVDVRDRPKVFDALSAIDAVHREALHRLVRLFKEGVLEQVVTDPAIGTLMGMYDLLPAEKTDGATRAAAGASGTAARRVWPILPAVDDARLTDAATAADPPHWSAAPLSRPPRSGEALVCQMEEGRFVVAAADGRQFAFGADCPVHGAPMTDGRLDGVSWICPLGPACVYDIRSGARLGGGEPLDCRPVRADGRRVLIGFGVPFSPKLPAC